MSNSSKKETKNEITLEDLEQVTGGIEWGESLKMKGCVPLRSSDEKKPRPPAEG